MSDSITSSVIDVLASTSRDGMNQSTQNSVIYARKQHKPESNREKGNESEV